MRRMTDSQKAHVRYVFRHPGQWLRGDHLPPEATTPFEKLTQIVTKAFGPFLGAFTGYLGFLYAGNDPGKVTPAMRSVSGAISTTWDAVNDPLIGGYMDAHPWKTETHRRIMRATGILGPLTSAFLMLDLGITPLTRIVMWTVLGIVNETLGTFAQVSTTKFTAAVTPHTRERRKLEYWNTIGKFIGSAVKNLPTMFLGLRTILGVTQEQIFIIGAFAALPFALAANLLPTFMRQRVEFPVKTPEDKYPGVPPLKKAWFFVRDTVRDFGYAFSIARHNTWFMRTLIGNFITVFAPGINERYFYRFLIRPFSVGKLQFESEMLQPLKDGIVSIPATVMMPMANRFIKKVGGDKNMVVIDHATKAATKLLRYFVGMRTFTYDNMVAKNPKPYWPQLLFCYFMDMLEDIPSRPMNVARGVINYNMYDYVEWKTGVRSEGVVMAVNALAEKLITGNVNNIVGNAVIHWSGFRGTSDEHGRTLEGKDQPKRYIDIIWPMLYLSGGVSQAVWFFLRWLWKYPGDREQIEAELIERRALAKKLKEEAQAPPQEGASI